MDQSFHQARNKFTKTKPKQALRPKDKFRRQLERNPYGVFLSQMSCCTLTQV
ncbi:hypothetical protein QBC36DRAFT_317694 [Triangularia setosa]|uniref:Uncharacterized protein n=1 Tax=Triangularia setosa TaxID=2587417 RepID=A0AAN6WGB3_9PEZI|nr:hypothetical protein QBC36DRAFT_317694 [Podospora setosa]